jgi:MSHA biogenesis protein MshG
MPLYFWRGRNARGELVEGRTDAKNEVGVADELMAMRISPVLIQPAPTDAEPKRTSWLKQLNTKPITDSDVLMFSRQMYTLDRAGVPILRALSGLQASNAKPAMVELIKEIRSSLDQGRDFATALARHPAVFNHFFISMVRVGELTGKLTDVFLKLAEHMEFERDVRVRIKQALRYPSFVITALVFAIVVINVFVIPVFAKVFAGFNAELPPLTRGLIGFSDWMVAWWVQLVMASVAAVFAIRAYLKTPKGRYKWDRLKLSLPLVGDLILKSILARFARSFALCSESGLPLVQGLTVVSQTVENAFISARIDQMKTGIERGESIASCAAATGIFTPVVMQMIIVGEESGELDKLLYEIAAMYDRETDYSVKGLSSAIEPLLLLSIGGLLLLIALGVFLPLWNLSGAAMGRGG